jgi:hypothetical protein
MCSRLLATILLVVAPVPPQHAPVIAPSTMIEQYCGEEPARVQTTMTGRHVCPLWSSSAGGSWCIQHFNQDLRRIPCLVRLVGGSSLDGRVRSDYYSLHRSGLPDGLPQGVTLAMTAPTKRLFSASPHQEQGRSPEPTYCIVGDTLCRVCVWTEDEWDRLDPAQRPSTFEHVPGLGWVGAVPETPK